MIDALRYEGLRIRTIATTYWILVLGLVLCALVALGLGIDTRGADLPLAAATLLLTAGGGDIPFAVLGLTVSLIGILSTGHEYRYGTILPTLTAIPRRSLLLGAKVLVVAAVSAVAAVASIALCWLVGSIARGELLPVTAAPVPIVLVGHVILVTLYGVLGVALGQLTRSIPVALVIVLVTPLVVEPVLSALSGLNALSWLRDVVAYLPFSAGMRLVALGLAAAGEAGATLGRWQGGAVFALFVAVLLGAGWVLFARRDA